MRELKHSVSLYLSVCSRLCRKWMDHTVALVSVDDRFVLGGIVIICGGV